MKSHQKKIYIYIYKRNFLSSPLRAFTHLYNAIPDFTDNNLINIIRYGQDYYASSEVNYINQIDPVTLETIGRVSVRACYPAFITFCSLSICSVPRTSLKKSG